MINCFRIYVTSEPGFNQSEEVGMTFSVSDGFDVSDGNTESSMTLDGGVRGGFTSVREYSGKYL